MQQTIALPLTNTEAQINAAAEQIGGSIAKGIIERIEEFREREELLSRKDGMDSLPEDILWDGLQEEAPPVFVLYKLVHESYSTAPRFFRSALVQFLRAQDERFSHVFSRETIWSVLATSAINPDAKIEYADVIRYLKAVQKNGIWWRSDEEITREAKAICANLNDKPGKFRNGLNALRSLQVEKGQGLVAGNIMLAVPGRLAAYASEVRGLANDENLPSLEEMHDKVDEIARDPARDARNKSIPIDLLYTTTEDDLLHCRILARSKSGANDLGELREKALFTRYFLRKAFSGYQPQQIDLRAAIYLDADISNGNMEKWSHYFHEDEIEPRNLFWSNLCATNEPDKLLKVIRDTAAKELAEGDIVELIKKHFNREKNNHAEAETN